MQKIGIQRMLSFPKVHQRCWLEVGRREWTHRIPRVKLRLCNTIYFGNRLASIACLERINIACIHNTKRACSREIYTRRSQRIVSQKPRSTDSLGNRYCVAVISCGNGICCSRACWSCDYCCRWTMIWLSVHKNLSWSSLGATLRDNAESGGRQRCIQNPTAWCFCFIQRAWLKIKSIVVWRASLEL